jgi:hypothetical protein
MRRIAGGESAEGANERPGPGGPWREPPSIEDDQAVVLASGLAEPSVDGEQVLPVVTS